MAGQILNDGQNVLWYVLGIRWRDPGCFNIPVRGLAYVKPFIHKFQTVELYQFVVMLL